MIAIVSREVGGKFPEVGMSDKTIFTHYKTVCGLLRYGVRPYAKGKRCRVELFHDRDLYKEPYRVFEVAP